MNIVSLKIKNFLSISDVEIKPGQINQIVGRNNAGKTTIIKAIEFAAKGGTDPKLVKFGADEAEVMIELDDQTTIRRRLTSAGRQSVDVKKDGFKAATPQALLDSLFEHSAFNPLDLLDPKKRNDAILSSIDIKIDERTLQSELATTVPLPPVDYNQHGLKVLDQAHKYLYQRRAEANKDAAEKKKRWETYNADLPKDVVTPKSATVIRSEIDAVEASRQMALNALNEIRNENMRAKEAEERIIKYLKAVEDIDQEIADVQTHLQNLRGRREEAKKFVDKARYEMPVTKSEVDALQKYNDFNAELERVKAQFKDVEKYDAINKQIEMVKAMQAEYEKAKKVADGLTVCVEKLAGPLKAKVMSTAEMPIAGLEYKDGIFLVDGVPVDNLSSSKTLKLAVGVARKLAKKTKLICADGVEALDDDTLKAFFDEIRNDGFVYFLTMVGDSINHDGVQKFIMNGGKAIQCL